MVVDLNFIDPVIRVLGDNFWLLMLLINPRTYFLLLPGNIMKKFTQLVLYSHWLRSPYWRGDILRYCSSSRKMVVLLVKVGKREKRKQKHTPLSVKYFQTTFFKSYIAVAKWRQGIAKEKHCKVKPLQLSAILPCLYMVRIQTK